MASINTPHTCELCKKKRRKCIPSEFDPHACTKCLEVGIECSLSSSRMIPSMDAKRKFEEIGPTPNREPSRPIRASSSATASHDPHDSIVPPPKKSRPNEPAQSATLKSVLPPQKRQNISSGACGICRKKKISSGETKGDDVMLKCDINTCPRWYHLSCIQFKSRGKQIFQSFATGTKKSTFFCLECFNPKRKDLVDAVSQAELDFKTAMERIKQAVTAEKKGGPQVVITPQNQENSHAVERDTLSAEMDALPFTDFEQAKEDRYQGFQVEIIKSFLDNIEQAVYDYDREINCANDLFLDGNEVLKYTPLKVWSQIDPGQHLVPGKEWFHVDGMGNNLSESHAPITAALRQILGIPDDKPLRISPDTENLSFSQVHKALINWFVFDLLNDALNMYHFPNMKPLKATQSAVANFGDARWKGNGKRVLREVQLRAWHKTQYREEVIENACWQGDLIRRLESFLAPMTKQIGKIDPRSESRANIIKHTVELWSYLEAALGVLEIIHPAIGAVFNKKTSENADDEIQSSRDKRMEIKWVLRRGFRFRESCSTNGKNMLTKAIVIVE